MNDMACGLAPLSLGEATHMIGSLRGYKMLEGMRGQKGINLTAFAKILVNLSWMLQKHPEIAELDLNPIMVRGDQLAVVDARIRIARPENA